MTLVHSPLHKLDLKFHQNRCTDGHTDIIKLANIEKGIWDSHLQEKQKSIEIIDANDFFITIYNLYFRESNTYIK